jgi:hypothetical protein
MPNDEPGLRRNAYASEGFSLVGFLWKPEAPLQISEGGEQVMKSDWGLGSSLLLRFSWESCPGQFE